MDGMGNHLPSTKTSYFKGPPGPSRSSPRRLRMDLGQLRQTSPLKVLKLLQVHRLLGPVVIPSRKSLIHGFLYIYIYVYKYDCMDSRWVALRENLWLVLPQHPGGGSWKFSVTLGLSLCKDLHENGEWPSPNFCESNRIRILAYTFDHGIPWHI